MKRYQSIHLYLLICCHSEMHLVCFLDSWNSILESGLEFLGGGGAYILIKNRDSSIIMIHSLLKINKHVIATFFRRKS